MSYKYIYLYDVIYSKLPIWCLLSCIVCSLALEVYHSSFLLFKPPFLIFGYIHTGGQGKGKSRPHDLGLAACVLSTALQYYTRSSLVIFSSRASIHTWAFYLQGQCKNHVKEYTILNSPIYLKFRFRIRYETQLLLILLTIGGQFCYALSKWKNFCKYKQAFKKSHFELLLMVCHYFHYFWQYNHY